MYAARLARRAGKTLMLAVVAALSAFTLLALAGGPSAGAFGGTKTFGNHKLDLVTRQGSQLMLDGQPWRASGGNIYWLGLDENGRTGLNYPTHFRVRDALATVSLMGGTVVRAHTLGISTGNPLSLEPSLGVWNKKAFESIDYAIKTARDYGIRLIIPFTDNWTWYHGGYHDFTDWLGLPKSAFYTDPTAIAAFEDYISHLLNHVNRYTGIRLKDDPTILAWETGNELSNPNPPAEWTEEIASFVKHDLGAKQLFMDGTSGINSAALPEPDVDIYSDHFYPLNITKLNNDASMVSAADKVYSAGEYGWTRDSGTTNTLPNFLAAIEANPGVNLDQYWSLFPRNDDWSYVQHFDNYQLHYPGDTPDLATRVSELRTHAFAMSGRAVPALPRPGTPVITNVEHLSTGNLIEWRGTAAASTYSVQRSTEKTPFAPWTTVCDACATDTSAPWLDAGAPDGPKVWYRAWAVNGDGVAGRPSASFQLSFATMVDPLNDFSLTYSHSDDLVIDSTNPSYYYGDTARAARTTAVADEIVWRIPAVRTFELDGYFAQGGTQLHFVFSTSANGMHWKEVPVDEVLTHIGTAQSGSHNNQAKWVYTIGDLHGANYVKVTWIAGGSASSPQIGEVRATYLRSHFPFH